MTDQYMYRSEQLTLEQIRETINDRTVKSSSKKAIELIEGTRIVDLGCSAGRITARIARKYPDSEVIGKDIESDHIEIARQLYDDIPNLTYEVGSTEELSEPEESVDCVLLKAVLEHLKSPYQAIRNISRILKPGGSIIVVVPNAYHWKSLLANLKRSYQKATDPSTYRFHDEPEHACHFTTWDTISLNTVLNEEGFEFEQMDFAGFLGPEHSILDDLLPLFCYEIIMKGRKKSSDEST